MSTRTARPQMTQSRNSRSEVRETAMSEAAGDVIDYVRDQIRANPEAAALWCFGIGFVLGWKIKPW